MNATRSSNSTDMIVESCWDGFIVHRPSPSYVLNLILASVLNTTIGLIGTILNSLVLFIFWKSQKMRKKISSMMIMVLSSNDLAVLTILTALILLQSVTNIIGAPNCLYSKCYQALGVMVSMMSLMTLLVMNIDRYLSIVHPVFHRAAMTKKNYGLILASLWAIVTVPAVIRAISPLASNTIISFIFVTHVCITLFTYMSIFFVAKKRLTKVNPAYNVVNTRDTSSNFAGLLRELKLARAYLLIVFLCFVCYSPLAIFTALWNHLQTEEDTRNICIQGYPWAGTLILVNSAFNCLVFFWSNRELRKEASKIVKMFFRRE